MGQRNRFWQRRIAAILLALVVLGGVAFGLGQTSEATSPWQLLTRQARGIPPESRATGSPRGGGGRGPICLLAEPSVDGEPRSVVAMMPVFAADEGEATGFDDREALPVVDGAEGADNAVYVGGYTVEAQPTFWFYVPYVAEDETPDLQSSESLAQATAAIENIRVGKFVLLDQN
jgi:hypothetical protein